MKISCTQKLGCGTFILGSICTVGGFYVWPLWVLAGVSFGTSVGLCCLKPEPDIDYLYTPSLPQQQPPAPPPSRILIVGNPALQSAPSVSAAQQAASAAAAPLEPPAILLAYNKAKSQNHIKNAMSVSTDFPQFRKMSF